MMPVTPHNPPTFAFNAKGQTTVVEQGGEQDLEARAKNVLVCPVGFREDLPEFGIDSPLFQNVPLNLTELQGAVSKWANLHVSISEHSKGLEAAVRQLEVTVGP